jgi:hypothetical protein
MRCVPSPLGFTLLACALGLGTSSCADVAGLEDFHKRAISESASTASEYFAMKLQLVAMKPHLGHLLEYRIVDASNYVQSRGVIGAMTSEDAEIVVQRAIPRGNGPYRLDFFADVNHSGGFDGLGSVVSNDHAWRVEPLVPNPDELRADDIVTVTFLHSTSFTNIDHYPSGTPNPAHDTELGARVRIDGLGTFAGKTVEMRVVDKRTRHVVGLYRTMRAEGPVLDAVVPGCVDIETEYDVDVWADANGNGAYDSPESGVDRGFRVTATSTDKGLDAHIDLASATAEGFDRVDVGQP